MPDSNQQDKLRVDKWLWAARFYKTRSLAAHAVEGGKVAVNGARVKPARTIKVGDELHIATPGADFVVHVRALADKRGSAPVAATLYEETADSRERREQAKLERGATHYDPHVKGRPTKRARRLIHKFKGDLV